MGNHTMSRGEMIRRLDDASREVHERLDNGPLSPDERHVLAATLTRLLPMVADSLQEPGGQGSRSGIASRRPGSKP